MNKNEFIGEPIEYGMQNSEHGANPQSAIRIPQSNNLQSTAILIVEDSPMEALMLHRSLDKAGYRVAVAKNGAEGLQAVRAHHPALVISDIQMPLINGYDLCSAIKQDEALWNIPVILISSLSEPEDIIEALKSGADSYVTKPFVETRLLERIHSLLSMPSHRNRLDMRRSEKVEYLGKAYTINSGSQQMLNLLLSVYDSSLGQNRDLTRIQTQLNLMNENLEEQVRERTADLLLEKKKLERVNRTLRTLSSCNVALSQALTEDELLQTVCRHIVEIGDHLLAWVAYPPDAGQQLTRSMAYYGDEALFWRLIEQEQNPENNSKGLTVSVLREHRVISCNQLVAEPDCNFCNLGDMGVNAILALPLLHNSEVYGVLTIFSASIEALDDAEIKLMKELAGDLAFGIITLRLRSERDQAVAGELRNAAELRQTMEQTITAIALTLEKRDAYTAGHQQRVASLATLIATEMGLPPKQVEGIRFGALLHNIGTVAIPAEILSRPGKLSELQFSLIKMHTETGFEIVKDINFPWPVAQMVLQHHENMDGSGYPQGLKDEQIMLEARILAVADVLEAMISYRPYRAAFELDRALDLLMQGRGTKFDADVVDACVRVVKQQGLRCQGDAWHGGLITP